MDILVLRLIHILSGVFWVGAVFTMYGFLQPTAERVGPEGQKFMLHLLRRRRFGVAILVAAALAVAAGLILYWRDSSGLRLSWMLGPGLGFTVGGAAALVAFVIGTAVITPNISRLETIGGRLQDEARTPTEEEARALQRVQATLKPMLVIVTVLLGIAVISMATARYWGLVLRG